MQASLSWLRQGYLPPESRSQNVYLPSENGDEVILSNFDKGKASEYARSIALTLGQPMECPRILLTIRSLADLVPKVSRNISNISFLSIEGSKILIWIVSKG